MVVDLSAGKVLLRVGIRGLAAALPGGVLVGALFEEVAMPFADAVWAWMRGQPPSAQQQAIDALALLPPAQARSVAEEELATTNLGTTDRARLLGYLSAVPMTTRRAISRTSDGGQPSVLLSQLPRGRDSVLAFLPLRPPRFSPGDRVPAHDLELELLLGQGGFGEVWKARHLRRKSEPPRALKFCLEPALQVSLERELELLDHIEHEGRHEGIVQLLGTALSADPPFLIYEFIDGGDLVSWMAGFEGQPPPADAVARALQMACAALAYAHERGILHLDLKPANLLVTRDGRVKIADFGIGRLVAETEEGRGQTEIQSQLSALHGACTPLYADRAQRRGERVDARADVYALGVIGYQLLMGDVTLSLPSYWREELQERGAPAALLDVLAACVSLPSRRLADARAVLSELARAGAWRQKPVPLAPDSAASAGKVTPTPELPPPSGPPPRRAGTGGPKRRRVPGNLGRLTCPDCGRRFNKPHNLERHAAIHRPGAPSASASGPLDRRELEVLAGAELERKVTSGRAGRVKSVKTVQSADILAAMAESTGATVQEAAAVVDAFWSYVANVKNHYRAGRQPVLIIPRFGTFRVRDPRSARRKTLLFRSSPQARASAPTASRTAPGATLPRPATPPPSSGGLVSRLTSLLRPRSSSPSPPVPSVGSPRSSTGGPRIGWTSSVLAGRAKPEDLSVRRRIAWHISAATKLSLPRAAHLFETMLSVVVEVFQRQTASVAWAKRGVMEPAPARRSHPTARGTVSLARGRYYRFRCYPSFAQRLRT